MMPWQDLLRLAEADGRSTPEFLEWLRDLVAKLEKLEDRIAALE